MIVCVCKAINDRRLEREIARGARSLGELARACGAGTDCGRCVEVLRERLASCRHHEEDPLPLAAK